MPFFSIVIPTRNRARLLVDCALKSVLRQSFEDYEVIVGDNASTDNTEDMVKGIDDDRVRCIRTPEWIPKERFFEVCLSHARGNYCLLFSDDDALTYDALSRCHGPLDAFSPDFLSFSNAMGYHFNDWHEPEKRNLMMVSPFTNEVYLRESRTELEKLYATRGLIPGIPVVTNAFYKTSFIQGLTERYSTLFPHGHMGDYNIACYTLANTKYFLYFDRPVIVFGHWSENTPQQLHNLQTSMPEYQEWITWITEHLLASMPFRGYLFKNCIVATLLDMKQRLDLPFTIDWDGYFDDIQREILRLSRLGIDVSQLQKEYESAVRNRGGAPQPVRKPEESAQSLVGEFHLRFRGERHGFHDVLSAAEFFEHLEEPEAEVIPDEQRRLFLMFRLGKFLGRCVRAISGKRGYAFVLKYAGTLAKLVLIAVRRHSRKEGY